MITISIYMFGYVMLLCHLFADYCTQSDWMAMHKSKKTFNCLVHCILYTLVFLIITTSWKALLFIFVTHFIIDRFPVIVKRLIWFKNHMNPNFMYPPFKFCDTTGYYDDSPYNSTKLEGNDKLILGRDGTDWAWGTPRLFGITMWLYIITDNMIHLICNYVAIVYLK